MIRIFVCNPQREFAEERAARVKFGENLRLADSKGQSRTIRIVEMLDPLRLVDYGPRRTQGDAA